MNSRSRIMSDMSNLLKVIGFIVFLPLIAGPAWAQSSSKAKGEVVSASQTKINGFSAISGMTIFTNNRVMTGQHGSAVINLGKLGRIEFGAETDMTLRLSEASIGGELRSNRVVVSARAGIAIAVNTAKSIVTTDGRQPAVLTIYLDGNSARVIAHVGEASIVPTGKEDPKEGRPAGGKELSQSPRGNGWKRAGMVAGAVGAASVAKIGVQGAAAAPNAQTFAGLFKAGINYSIDPKFNRGQDSEESFETSMTCRDSDKKYCRKKSRYTPQRP